MYQISLITSGTSGVQSTIVATETSRSKAFAMAKRAAGRGARYVAMGVDICYVGPAGTAYIGGASAERCDQQSYARG